MPFVEHYELLIEGLRFWISLGCTIEERTHLQPVEVAIRIGFPKEPLGCHSDQLSDVLCYKTVVERVLQAVEKRPFALIERLAACIFEVLVLHFSLTGSIIEITVAKPHHPVPHVNKNIVFKYCKEVT